MTQSLQELTTALLDAARDAGAEAAEALAVRGTSLSAETRAGALEHVERSEGVDLGLRVLQGRRQAIVSTSDMNPNTLRNLAERAVAMANEAPEDPYAGLAEDDALGVGADPDSLDLADPAAAPSPDALTRAAMEAEAAAAAVDGVSQVESASASYTETAVHLAATNGFSGGYARTQSSIGCSAISGTGTEMERDYDADARVYWSDMRSASEIGQLAGERACERRGARRPKTGSFPVLFDERISGSLIGHLLQASNGAAVARGSSWLRDALEKQVLPETLTVTENPHRPRVFGSRPFDVEGLPTRTRKIVDEGILTGWTLDLASARKLGLSSTANAARSVAGPPSPTNWNIELTQGDASREDLIAQMGTGLLVTSMIGSTINPTTGDYSRGASGFWVENGEIAYPVNECTIAGNLKDMLLRMVPANDARAHLSRVIPSLLVEGLTLAGE
ncbi:MAG: TldD/PmbA family protein [Paracoccaceae bacterium]